MVGIGIMVAMTPDEERNSKMGAIIALLTHTNISKTNVYKCVGITNQTFINWQAKYADFRQRLEEAKQTNDDLVREGIRKRIRAEIEGADVKDKNGRLINNIDTIKWYAERRMEEFKEDPNQSDKPVGAVIIDKEQLDTLQKTKKI